MGREKGGAGLAPARAGISTALREEALAALLANSDEQPDKVKRNSRTRRKALDMVLIQGMTPAETARALDVTRQRVHAILKVELERLQRKSEKVSTDDMQAYRLSAVMAARREVGELPAFEIPDVGVFYGKVVSKNAGYFAILDEERRVIQLVKTAAAIAVPRLAKRVRVRMRGGMATVDSAP